LARQGKLTMPQTTPYPVQYLIVADDGELAIYDLPLGVDAEIAVADVIAAHDLDIAESSSPDAWLLTLGLQHGRPCIEEHRSIWLPDYDPDAAADPSTSSGQVLDEEPETLEGEIPGPDYYEETFGL
jgi:hypothetical protein